MERDLRVSLPDLEAEERATYYSARSVPVDSAALYEAVNAYVDALTDGRVFVAGDYYGDCSLYQDRIERALRAVIEAFANLSNLRAERRAQQTEREL